MGCCLSKRIYEEDIEIDDKGAQTEVVTTEDQSCEIKPSSFDEFLRKRSDFRHFIFSPDLALRKVTTQHKHLPPRQVNVPKPNNTS